MSDPVASYKLVTMHRSSPDRQDGQMAAPVDVVVAGVVLAPGVELLVPRIAVVVLGQPEEPGGRRTVAVAGENLFKIAFAFNGVYIFSFFARRQSPAL